MVDLFTGDFSYNIPLLDVGGYPVNLFYRSGILAWTRKQAVRLAGILILVLLPETRDYRMILTGVMIRLQNRKY